MAAILTLIEVDSASFVAGFHDHSRRARCVHVHVRSDISASLHKKPLLQVYQGFPRAGHIDIAGFELLEDAQNLFDVRLDDLTDMRFQ